MTTVGIIANPISGKDIRRLVAHGSVFDNQEKVRIVRRIMMGLSSLGVQRVMFMPDYYAIVPRAQKGIHSNIELISAPMCADNSQDDSTKAARLMAEAGVGCIFVLGGDGTSRAVTKGNATIPILPISTGTNNVFPFMIEATIAGLAGGLIASGQVSPEQGCFRPTCLEILNEDGSVRDIALVDAAVHTDTYIGSKAIWSLDQVSQIFLTRCRPDTIGLSAIGGQLHTISPRELQGLHLTLGTVGTTFTAPIAPGLIEPATVTEEARMKVGDTIFIKESPCVIALDGEREVEVRRGEHVSVRLSAQGPLVVDVSQVMATAQQDKLFMH
ncbi:ATP-NAD kinase family protein [Desulfogranum japonicum]|uniref:ATP-NAD kinase family protein n=1 Tax=Desulfogranum japonicum TaxID=231447 RepID=UPI0004132F26|nr:NAD(+)/NADH kinase [Desulfogranum japonicum]